MEPACAKITPRNERGHPASSHPQGHTDAGAERSRGGRVVSLIHVV